MDRRAFLVRSAGTAAALGALTRLTSCERRAASRGSEFGALRERYFRKFLELNPVTATYLGGDGYDPSFANINGRLRDYRRDALDAEAKFYRDIEGALRGIDTGTLNAAERIDHQVMAAQIAFMLHQMVDRRYHERAVDTYVAEPFRGIDWQIQGMTDTSSGDTPGRGTEAEWRLVVDRLRAIPAYLDTAKTNLQAGRVAGNLPDRRMIERDGVNGSKANAEYFRKTLPQNAKEFLAARPFAGALETELTRAGEAAAAAWEDFAAFLLQAYDPSDVADRFAVGEEEYAWRLKNCLKVSRSPAELWDYGESQVALYENQIFTVAEEVARANRLNLPFDTAANKRTSIRSVMDWLSRDSPRDDDELFQWYREAGERAVAYGREQQLFDIPQDYRLQVTATPPVLRSTIDAAYYPAPPFKHAGVGRFYLTPTDNNPAALKLNNRASVPDTAVHEGFPGHDWHYKFMTQHAAEISNIRWLTPGAVEDSSSMWEDSMAAEGWGLYCEDLMAEPSEGHPHGFYSAAEHLYELQGQLLRAVRVRVDVGLHTGRMTFDEAIDYFVEHVSFSPNARTRTGDPTAQAITDGATRAIYRYSKWPTQAITYNLGKNDIFELREAVVNRGKKLPLRAFHERFMGMGTIPVGYYRDQFIASAG